MKRTIIILLLLVFSLSAVAQEIIQNETSFKGKVVGRYHSDELDAKGEAIFRVRVGAKARYATWHWIHCTTPGEINRYQGALETNEWLIDNGYIVRMRKDYFSDEVVRPRNRNPLQ